MPLKSVAGGRTLAYLTNDLKTGGTPHMEFNHELIVVILNEGYADLVMDAARAAGAGGGTVLHAKGTGSKRGEKLQAPAQRPVRSASRCPSAPSQVCANGTRNNKINNKGAAAK